MIISTLRVGPAGLALFCCLRVSWLFDFNRRQTFSHALGGYCEPPAGNGMQMRLAREQC